MQSDFSDNLGFVETEEQTTRSLLVFALSDVTFCIFALHLALGIQTRTQTSVGQGQGRTCPFVRVGISAWWAIQVS